MAHVTIVIPCAGKGEYFKEVLGAVIEQSHQDFTVVVCDNASPTDNYRAAAFAFCDKRIIYKRYENRLPMAVNWQRALMEVNCGFFCILHDDDVWSRNYLSSALGKISCEFDFVLSRHESFFVDEHGALCKSSDASRWKEIAALDQVDLRVFLCLTTWTHLSATIFNKPIVSFDASTGYVCDQKFLGAYSIFGKGVINIDTTVNIRQHGTSITSGFSNEVANFEIQYWLRSHILALNSIGIDVVYHINKLVDIIGGGPLSRIIMATYSWPVDPVLLKIGNQFLCSDRIKNSLAGYSFVFKILSKSPALFWVMANLIRNLINSIQLFRKYRK